MKNNLFTVFIGLLLIHTQILAQSSINQMTSKEWKEDLEFLHKKIQAQFASFIPGIKDKFSQEVKALEMKLPQAKNYEVPCEFMRILSTLQDGHTELNPYHRNVGFHRVPLSLYFFQNELYVLAAHKTYSELIGAKVVGIGNLKTQDAFEKLKANMSKDNDMEYISSGPSYLILTELMACLGISENSQQLSLQLEFKDGSTITKSIEGITYKAYSEGDWFTYYGQHKIEMPLYLKNRDKSYWYSYLPEHKTMYFHFARVNNQKGKPSIKKFTAELFKQIDQLKPEKLIIDFRLNNGGNYNLSRPLVEAIKSRDWLNQKGKVWAITGRRTFSAASTACIFLKQETQTQLIGEPGRTHPNWADNNEYMTLPNSKFLIEYTTKVKVHWPEMPEADRVPVDVSIEPAFKTYAQGIDPVMQYLLDL